MTDRRDTSKRLRAMRADGVGMVKVAKAQGIGVSAVQRIEKQEAV